MLKQALLTSVAVDKLEFEEFSVEDQLHIVISVKDFKAIVWHADSVGAKISAHYSHPMRPMQISYDGQGVRCEFTLMTTGELQGVSMDRRSSARHRPPLESMKPVSRASSRPDSSNMTGMSMQTAQHPAARSHHQASASLSQRRPSPPPPKASLDDQSLFFPEGDDDQRWKAYDPEDGDGDLLGWDTSAGNLRSQTYVRNREASSNTGEQRMNDVAYEERIAPTQRVSQVRTAPTMA